MTWNSSDEERSAAADITGTAAPRRESTSRRVGAKLLVTDGFRALLIRERRRDGSTFWTLPGGGIHPGESLVAGLRREIGEELGCECTVDRVVATCRYRHRTRPETETTYAVFDGRLRSPADPNPDEGVTDCAWVAPGDVPPTLLDPFRRVVFEAAFGPGAAHPSARTRNDATGTERDET